MANINNYQCPCCTGPMRFDGNTGKVVCDYCDTTMDVAEVEALSKERAEKIDAAAKSTWKVDDEIVDWGQGSEAGMKAYSCPQCGAELVCEEHTAATCCPYCGNQTVIENQFKGALKPEYIIPFKTDKEKAIAALKNHYKGKALLPKTFVDGNHIEEIQGVYVPFWLYDGEAEGDFVYKASNTKTQSIPGGREKITDHYIVRRQGKLKFEKVPADASSRMPDTHMDSIEPFDYKELKEFSTVYMPGFLADRYDVEAKDCASRMEDRCEKTLIEAIDKTVKYDDKDNVRQDIIVKRDKVHYAMLPVWMLNTKWNGKDYLFAMNGQTGKLTGDLPIDWGKFWGNFFITLAIAAAVIIGLTAACTGGFNPERMGDFQVGLMIVAPLLIAFIRCMILKSAHKSVYTPLATAYITEDGLNLKIKTDQFIRQTKEVIMDKKE